MEEKRICPECGKEYSSRPALSRKDNKTMICPKCGMMEALDTVRDFYAPGMTDQQWKQYKEEYMLKYIKENEKMRKLFKNLTAIGLSVTMVVGTASMASAAVAKGTDVSNGKAWTSYSIHTREDREYIQELW